MKKVISLILVFVMCLSLCACGQSNACTCDCAQCAQCEKKTQSHDAVETTQVSSVTATEMENDKNQIVFPEPVLLAEDKIVRVELISFFEEDSPYKHIGKYVTMKFTNKADYEIGVWLKNLAVDGNAVECSYPGAQKPTLLPGETTTYYLEILDTFKNALDSVEQLYTLKGRFEVLERTGSNSYKNSYEIPFSVASSLEKSVYVSDNTDAWMQFWEYLQSQGPVTVVTQKTDTGHNQVTITATEDAIQILQEGENTTISGKVTAQAINSLCFDLTANAQNVTVQIEYWVDGSDGNGNPQIQSSSPQFIWDIQTYHSGDKVSVPAEYTCLDENGKSMKKEGVILPTGALVEVTDVLSQTLLESGLNLSMADLGFTNF